MADRQWPLPSGYRLTSGFGPRWGTHHSGIDIGAPDGTPFYACADGIVQYIGAASGYGQWIVIDHPAAVGGGCTEYGHMWNAFATGLKAGDKVRKGQLIGYVGSNGQSTGPHLHLTVWERGYGGRRIDPEVWLSGYPHPDRPAVSRPASTPASASTPMIFGVDISEHQDGMSLVRAAQEGIKFAILRTTDGTYKDRCYTSHYDDAKKAGLPCAAYHYLRNPSEGTSIAQQVQASIEVMGERRLPMWIDVETEAGLHVDHIRQCKRLFEAAGVPVIGAYSYVPYWEGRISPCEPDSHEFGAFWVAAYGMNPVGAPNDIYPGDGHKQWNYPLGNQKPVLWQFGSKAVVAGHKVDINAFRGSVDQLCELFKIKKNLGKDSAAMGKMLKEIWEQLRGADGKGWAQLGQNAQGQNLTLVDAVAALRQETAEIRRDLEVLKVGK